MTVSLFQPNLRKQIRNLPKILTFVKKIHYYSKLFTSLLRSLAANGLPFGDRAPGLRVAPAVNGTCGPCYAHCTVLAMNIDSRFASSMRGGDKFSCLGHKFYLVLTFWELCSRSRFSSCIFCPWHGRLACRHSCPRDNLLSKACPHFLPHFIGRKWRSITRAIPRAFFLGLLDVGPGEAVWGKKTGLRG